MFNRTLGYPAVAKEAVMKLSTHWAYYYFLSHLLEGDAICSSLSEVEPFYIVGDSHVLSSSWRNMTVQGRQAFPSNFSILLLLGIQYFRNRLIRECGKRAVAQKENIL
jgi:hypothetical protein